MYAKRMHGARMLTAALLLLPAIAGGCAATRTAAGQQKSPQERQERQAASDSCAVFIPTHPPVVFQKVCLGRRLQILQICKYSDSCFQIHTPRRVDLIFVL